jgi:amino acid permease
VLAVASCCLAGSLAGQLGVVDLGDLGLPGSKRSFAPKPAAVMEKIGISVKALLSDVEDGGGSCDRPVVVHGRAATTFLLVNYMIGSGVLNQPSVFASAGILGATFLYILSAVTLWLGLILLNQAAVKRAPGSKIEHYGYSDLARDSYGEKGARGTDGCITVKLYLAALSYVLLMGSIASSLLESWTGSETALTSFYFLCPLLTFVVVLPPCLLRHLSETLALCFVGLGAVGLVLLLVLFDGARAGSSARALDDSILLFDFSQMGQKLGSVLFTLSCTTASFHGYAGMRPQTQADWTKVTAACTLAGTSLCYIMGIAGYLSFRSSTEPNILDNFTGTVAANMSRISLLIHLAFYTPNEFIVLRQHAVQLFSRNILRMSFRTLALVTVALLTSMVVVNCILVAFALAEGELFGFLLDLAGGLCGSVSSLILPGLFYLKGEPGGALAPVANFLIFFGTLSAAIVASATISNLLS